jgi:hypothetical protein
MRGDPGNLEELQEWPEDYAIWAGKKLPHNIPERWLILAALLGCGVLIFAPIIGIVTAELRQRFRRSAVAVDSSHTRR